MASNTPMKKNTACTIVFPILDATGIPTGGVTNADSQYSLDGAQFVDCASEAADIHEPDAATHSGIYSLALAAGETNGDVVCITIASTEGKKTVLVFYTATQTLDNVDTVVDSILEDTAVIGALGAGLTAIPWNATWDAEVQSECTDALNAYDPPTRTEATADKDAVITEVNANETKIDTVTTDVAAVHVHVGTIDGHVTADYGTTEKAAIDLLDDADGGLADIHGVVGSINSKTTNLPTDPADDSDIDAQLATIAGYLDTEVAAILAAVDTEVGAIKAKTDNLPTTPADEATLTTMKQIAAGTYDRETDSLQAIRDRGDIAWVAGIEFEEG